MSLQNQIEKSIVLIGFMGVGKTTIGQLLAEKLNWNFIDIDEEIEKDFGMPVSQIFNTFGEKTFRERERTLITNLCKKQGQILSLGGGAFLQEEIRTQCLSSCTVIFLDLSWENWKDRLNIIIDTRPVLQGKSMMEIEELFYKRQDAYSEHHMKVETDNKEPQEVANEVINQLNWNPPKKLITVKGVTIGEGAPKICVPMVGTTLAQLIEEAGYLKTLDIDVVEWRVDFFESVEEIEKVQEALKQIRAILPEIPLIFTFRSAKEGGEKEISTTYYIELNQTIVETGLIDFIDVELFTDEKEIISLIEIAHAHHVYVILSNHDFEKTPSKEEIVSRLRRAQELGGDLPKMAVMPKNAKDVLTLLDATRTMNEQFADRPIITMSMAGRGVISRLAGEIFGSAVTFAAAKKASAPGQISITEMRNILSLLHSNLNA